MRLIVRPGICAKWPARQSVVKLSKKIPRANRDFYEKNIRDYCNRVQTDVESQRKTNFNVTDFYAEDLARRKCLETLLDANDRLEWLGDLNFWAACYKVGATQKFFWHHRYEILFSSKGRGGLNFYSFKSLSQMLGIYSLLGWKDDVIYFGYMAHAVLNRNYMLISEYKNECRRAQVFILRLFADWVGDVSHQWPSYGYDEPIYEALLEEWRNPDPEALVPCLLAACDRHTHQAGVGGAKVFFDFDYQDFLQRTPIEILFIFRLREWEGLANPVLDHPLMAAPFDRLPPVQPVPEIPELLQAVLKRAREDWPQYDEVVSLEALKAPPSRV